MTEQLVSVHTPSTVQAYESFKSCFRNFGGLVPGTGHAALIEGGCGGDLEGWMDNRGYACDTYANNDWCSQGWVKNYAVDGIDAATACCETCQAANRYHYFSIGATHSGPPPRPLSQLMFPGPGAQSESTPGQPTLNMAADQVDKVELYILSQPSRGTGAYYVISPYVSFCVRSSFRGANADLLVGRERQSALHHSLCRSRSSQKYEIEHTTDSCKSKL